MRAFDTWNSYLDNDGNLLHGKIRFCKKGTTDNVSIYNSSEVAIRNPEFTDMLGRTEYQVFLNAEDNVTAYFYKYIGTGDMMQWPAEDYDPSRWAYQYSSDNMDPTSSIELTADTASGVSSMADLRAVDPEEVPTVHGVKLMWLYGYYNAGDTSPVLYVWDSASLDSDDGGATIMSNHAPGRGRWKLATRELHFDVRHFGIFPLDDKYSTDYSYSSQMANCASYLDKEGLDAWFPSLNDDPSYYLLDGTNTFGIKGDIYVSDAVRFQVKSGTTGTTIVCHELHKATPYLFDSSYQNGNASLTADWVNISWVGGNCDGNARVGWVIDSSSFTRVITGKEVHFITNGSSSLQLNNCVITSNKQITGQILIQNSIIKTEFFADDYDWRNLTSIGNDIRLANCKDANTYILLKNKQNESNYGDLGEQQINADVIAGGTIENCYGRINFIQHGNTELHNASLDISGLTANDNLNCVSCWITVPSACVIGSIQMRRGALGYSGSTAAAVQLLNASMFDKSDINTPLTTLGADVSFTNCDINAHVSGDNIVLTNNHIYAEVEQQDRDGIISVQCSGNMFHKMKTADVAARHFIHGVTAGSKVNGIWTHNGSTYDTVHWIRLNRTNLLGQDNDHQYTYANNSEPYLMKYSGRNHPMRFPIYRGDRFEGRDVFRTTNLPFVFLNSRTYECYVVPRSVSWKCFSVGRGFLARSGTLRATWDYGIFEDSYNDHTNGYITIVLTWGAQTTSTNVIMGGSAFGYATMVSRDGNGEANYEVSFESADADHNPDTSPGGVFSNGTQIGVLTRAPYDGWGSIAKYPASPMQTINLFVHMDNDFQAGSTTPVNF